MEVKYCKYYNPHMETVLAYCSCLYKIEGCGAGGNLHILLDDGNYRDSDIEWCKQLCIDNPQDEESTLGILICDELLKLTMDERHVFFLMWDGWDSRDCLEIPGCKKCPMLSYKWSDEEYDL